ncbi:hypothetical protein P6144_03925 [Sphingomonas sp. HITSZ_GF]|uniref:hypothetical protein n=1 Tax=Sphingomonas sp. HITSZ_GF TaxID=3037247 RepID=UPI00240DF08B|nr:hypothetical protein [Sphingomonas sp. HITSZ_GF]MDG2532782.1 hypothetical protein [Sphingomonas sp. HITSZ_GF]
MKAALALLIATGTSFGIAAPAFAQNSGEAAGIRVAEKNAIELMSCFTRSEQRKAAAVIALEPGSEPEAKAFMGLFDSARLCVPRGKKVQTQGVSLRGVLAEQLYLKAYRAAGPATGGKDPAWLSQPVHKPYAVVQCAAARDPAAADALVRTKWHSPEEAAAVSAVLPAITACADGRTVNFDSTILRGLLAEGLFRARGGMSASEGSN